MKRSVTSRVVPPAAYIADIEQMSPCLASRVSLKIARATVGSAAILSM